MTEQELVIAFSKLDVKLQREQINYELQQLIQLLNLIHDKYGIDRMPSALDSINTKLVDQQNENSYYAYIYESLIYIRKDIITLTEKLNSVE